MVIHDYVIEIFFLICNTRLGTTPKDFEKYAYYHLTSNMDFKKKYQN